MKNVLITAMICCAVIPAYSTEPVHSISSSAHSAGPGINYLIKQGAKLYKILSKNHKKGDDVRDDFLTLLKDMNFLRTTNSPDKVNLNFYAGKFINMCARAKQVVDEETKEQLEKIMKALAKIE